MYPFTTLPPRGERGPPGRRDSMNRRRRGPNGPSTARRGHGRPRPGERPLRRPPAGSIAASAPPAARAGRIEVRKAPGIHVMDLTLTPEERAFQEEVRAFLRERLPDDVREGTRIGARMDKERHVRWQKILHEQGWMAPNWPVEHGGTGWTPLQRYLFEEEMEAAWAPPPIPFGVHMVGPVIIAFGTEAQKRRFLPGILASEDWWCQGYSEPGAGSDLAALKTRAVRDGDHYVVNGQKTWTSLAQHADWIFCLVRTSQEGKRQEGISFLLIDMHSPGVTVQPDPHHGRQRGDQRHLLRGGPRSRGESGRGGRQGLDLRQVPARARADRHRRGRPVQGPAPAHSRDRGERNERRMPARRGSAVPRAPGRDRGRPDGPRAHHPPDRLGDERGRGPLARRRRSSRSKAPRSSRR